jgi:hypothetical protein
MNGLPKGPWSSSLDGHGAFSIESATGNQICFVRNAEAACLIAAAPELLAALKTAVEVIGHPDDSFSVYIAKLIAKATGSQS